MIKRYYEGDPDAGMFESEDGFYVEFPDHEAAIYRLTAALKDIVSNERKGRRDEFQKGLNFQAEIAREALND